MKFSSFVRYFGQRWLQKKSGFRSGRRDRRLQLTTRRMDLTVETLEDRCLLAVVPTPVVSGHGIIADIRGNENSPQIAVDPTNPNKMVMVFQYNDPANPAPPNLPRQIGVEGRYTSDGGQTWLPLPAPPVQLDFNTANPTVPYAQATSPHVGFDRSGNVYFLHAQHSADNNSGALVLSRYTFTGAAPTLSLTSVVHRWIVDPIFNPTLVVDDTLPIFTDPDTGAVQRNDFAGNVYIAFAVNNAAPPNVDNFNPNVVKVLVSSDRGQTFSGHIYMSPGNTASNFGTQRHSSPRLIVSQGRADGSVPGGQLTGVFNDFGSLRNLNPARDQLLVYRNPNGAVAFENEVAGGPIFDAVDPGGGTPHFPVTTNFPLTITSLDPRFTTLSDLEVTVSAFHQDLGQLRMRLVAPNGNSVTLFQNRVNPDGMTDNPPRPGSITGQNLGQTTSGLFIGTTFDDSAPRFIQPEVGGGQAPYTGRFRPVGNLNAFAAGLGTNLTGTWRLEVTDFRNQQTGTIVSWKLTLTSRLQAGTSATVAVPGPGPNPANVFVLGALTAPYPAGQNISARGIGPDPTLASDNTLGSFSPNQGRIYLAYVNRIAPDPPNNPPDNTDIFLVASDNGGQTWFYPRGFVRDLGGSPVRPFPLNDDNAQLDGFSEAYVGPGTENLGGRPQFQPALAVDQHTGALVVSYYDTRYDAARVRPSRFVGVSIDGGASFGPHTFLNRPNQAIDAVTGRRLTIEPIPDNQSTGNNPNPGLNQPGRDATFGFGDRQGLVAINGRIIGVWSGNENGGLSNVASLDGAFGGTRALGIYTARASYAAGPRIVASTMGPIGQPGDQLNTQRDPDGTPLFSEFEVRFDRPIDPASFQVPGPGIPLLQQDFEAGLGAFTIDNRGPDGNAGTDDDGLWHLSTRRGTDPGHTPTTSVYYGREAEGDYDTGFRTAGALLSPLVTLPPGGRYELRFRYFLQTENVAPFDSAKVEVLAGATTTVVAANGGAGLLDPSGGFREFVGDLTPFAGQTIQLRFSFDTVDNEDNQFEGWYVDDVTVTQLPARRDIEVFYHGLDGVRRFFPRIEVASITPVLGSNNTRFRVALATPQRATGSYSYQIGPEISDRIRFQATVGGPVIAGNQMDQNANGLRGEVGFDVYAAPRPQTQGQFNFGTGVFDAPYDRTSLPIIIPGPHVVQTRVPYLFDPLPPQRYLPIPDASGTTPGRVESRIRVSGLTGTITNVQVRLSITHGDVRQLRISLRAPNGTTVVLADREGGTGPGFANFLNTTFTDSVTTLLSAGTAPFSGFFRPAQALSTFNGLDPSSVGTNDWLLIIEDFSTGISGRLEDWSLTLRTTTTDTPDNRVLNTAVRALDVRFDRDMAPATFTKEDVLRFLGPLGEIRTAFEYVAADLPRPIPDRLLDPAGQPTPLRSPLRVTDLYRITDLEVQVSIAHPQVRELRLVLVAPDGTRVTLVPFTGASGTNFTNTVFDDQAAGGLVTGAAPYTGTFRPAQPLSAFNGKLSEGDWVLEVTDNVTGNNGTLLNWRLRTRTELFITPDPEGTERGANRIRTFRVEFPRQDQGGTYTLNLGPDIQSAAGDRVDISLDAGVSNLRGENPLGISTRVSYENNRPATINANGITEFPITVADSYLLRNLILSLNISFVDATQLRAELVAPDGTSVLLFDRLPRPGSDFRDTVFDQAAVTPIANGAPPYSGRFLPQLSLAALNDFQVGGTWRLRIQNFSPTLTGTLNRWSFSVLRPDPTTGVGEANFDSASLGFRIFVMDPANPLSSSTWTAVGGAALVTNQHTGRFGGLAVDPSDPTGNTVFAAGASGGVWKTTNFLTKEPQGPRWMPLTDFGPGFSLNIGSIAVFGRNADPNQSIVFVATGEGSTGSPGVGFLRSMDGGKTWTLLDSTTNVDAAGNILDFNDPRRDHRFARGTTAFKIIVDPRLSPSGKVIVYAALSGSQGGIWRSFDTGDTWQLMRAGQATDVVFDPASGKIDLVSNPTGNLQILYAAFRGEGVFQTPNFGQSWIQMLGNVGTPLRRNANVSPTTAVPLNNPAKDPNGSKGRIALAKPFLTGVFAPDGTYNGNPDLDTQYQGWLYALVVTPGSNLDGLYFSKDFGQNWTYVRLSHLFTSGSTAIPSNDPTRPDQPVVGDQGNYDMALAINPNDPNVVYVLGQTGGDGLNFGDGVNRFSPADTKLVRIDTTTMADAHAFYLSNSNPDGGQLMVNSTAPVQLTDPLNRVASNPPLFRQFVGNPISSPTISLLRNPADPFAIDATIYLDNTARFSNPGVARWIPFDLISPTGADYHFVQTIRDPLTGLARLIVASDHSIDTGLDNGGIYQRSIGAERGQTVVTGTGSNAQEASLQGNYTLPFQHRTGNLQLNQHYYGAAQPSEMAALRNQVAGLRGLFYGHDQDTGFTNSTPDILRTGNITWNGAPFAPEFGFPQSNAGDAAGVATDPTGTGSVYQYKWPCCGGFDTDFFQVNGIGRTFGLLEFGDDPAANQGQWPALGTINFALNPFFRDPVLPDAAAVVIGSRAGFGKVFLTTNGGRFWLKIADPTNVANPGLVTLGGTADTSRKTAFAFGAPIPTDPTGGVNNHIYVGGDSGQIYVTYTGGGANGNQWTNISAGLDGSPVRAIATNPTRGTFEVYAVTTTGVFHLADSRSGQPWRNITGNLFSLTHDFWGPFADGQGTFIDSRLQFLNALAVDWRYIIPNDIADFDLDPNDPNRSNPARTHPALYVGGLGGVYRSLDDGRTWHHFPNPTVDNARRDGGYLPNAEVTDLDLSLGDINPTTGRPNTATSGTNLLLASTYGRGSFAIRVPPVILPQFLRLDRSLPAPRGSDNGPSNSDNVTTLPDPVIQGLSQESAFGNTVFIDLIDVTDPNQPIIGTGQTDVNGTFRVRIFPGVYRGDGTDDGIKTIGIRARDAVGNIGATVRFQFRLDTTPFIGASTVRLSERFPAGGSDTGRSATDLLTNLREPFVAGNVDQGSPVEIVLFDLNDPNQKVINSTLRTYTAAGLPLAIPDDPSQSLTSLLNVAEPVDYRIGDLDVRLSITHPRLADLTVELEAPDGTRVRLVNIGTVGADFIDTTFDGLAPLALNQGAAPYTGIFRPAAAPLQGLGQLNGKFINGTWKLIVTDNVAGLPGILNSWALLARESYTTDATGRFDVQVLPGVFTTDGEKRIGVMAVSNDRASNVVPLVIRIDTQRANPPAIRLSPASDSAVVGDNVTNITLVRFQDLVPNRRPDPETLPPPVPPETNPDDTRVNGRVEIFINGVLRATVDADPNDGTYISPLINLAEGTHTVRARQTDLAGNVSDFSTEFTVVVDVTPPSVPPTVMLDPASDSGVPGDFLTNDSTPTFFGQTEPHATIEIFARNILGGNPILIGTGRADATGAYTITATTALTNGTYTITARPTDQAGNIDPNLFGRMERELTIDLTAPAPVSIGVLAADDTNVVGDHVTRINTPRVTGLVSGDTNNVTVTIRDLAGNVVGQASVAPISGTYTLQLTTSAGGPLPDGTYNVTGTFTDLAGNASNIGLVPNLVVDTTVEAPVPDLDPADDSGIPGDHVTNVRRPAFIGQGVPGDTITVIIRQAGLEVQRLTTTVAANGTWRAVAATSLADGTYSVVTIASDLAGNVSGESAPLSPPLVIDTRPSLELVPADDSGIPGDHVTNVRRPRFRGEGVAGDTVTVIVSTLAGVEVQRTTALVGPDRRWEAILTTPLLDGTYDVVAFSSDGVNVSGESGKLTPPLTINTVPTVDLDPASDTGRSNTDHVTNLRQPRFRGLGVVGDTIVVFFRLPNGQEISRGAGLVGADGSWQAQPANPLPDGTYVVTAVATDGAGTVYGPETAPVPLGLTVDATPPLPPSIPDLLAADDLGFINDDNITNVTTPRFLVTGEPGAELALLANAQTQLAIGLVPGTGQLTLQTIRLADGTYLVTAVQTDLAGNVSPPSGPMQLVIDTVPPVVPTLALDPNSDTGTLGDNSTFIQPTVFNGTAQPDTEITILDGDTVIDRFQLGNTSTFQRTLDLGEGVHPLTVVSRDRAGNVSRSAPLIVTISLESLDAERRYIRALYLQALGRTGTLAEWTLWTPFLAQPNGRNVVASGIERSPEARTRLVNAWYQTYLLRSPGPGEVDVWVNLLLSGITEEQVLSGILSSPEYFNVAPTHLGGGSASNDAFIRALYRQLLDRNAADAEVAIWQGLLPQIGRNGVATAILTSAEYRTRIVRQHYNNLLGREPAAFEVNLWVLSGIDLANIRLMFLASVEFFLKSGGR